MHTVARLVLDPWVANVRASWVKMGPDGMRLALAAGANDAGGALVYSILICYKRVSGQKRADRWKLAR